MNYSEYISIFERYGKRDSREINFQNEIVKPFLRSIVPEFFIEDISTYYKSTEIHDRSKYVNLTDNESNFKSQPDLIICSNWHTDNRNNDLGYKATVEVKTPYNEDRIYSINYEKYDKQIKQVDIYIKSEKVNKVILTDTLKWEFYYKSSKRPLKTIMLCEIINGNNNNWIWKDEATFRELKSYISDFLNNPE